MQNLESGIWNEQWNSLFFGKTKPRNIDKKSRDTDMISIFQDFISKFLDFLSILLGLVLP